MSKDESGIFMDKAVACTGAEDAYANMPGAGAYPGKYEAYS